MKQAKKSINVSGYSIAKWNKIFFLNFGIYIANKQNNTPNRDTCVCVCVGARNKNGKVK